MTCTALAANSGLALILVGLTCAAGAAIGCYLEDLRRRLAAQHQRPKATSIRDLS